MLPFMGGVDRLIEQAMSLAWIERYCIASNRTGSADIDVGFPRSIAS